MAWAVPSDLSWSHWLPQGETLTLPSAVLSPAQGPWEEKECGAMKSRLGSVPWDLLQNLHSAGQGTGGSCSKAFPAWG